MAFNNNSFQHSQIESTASFSSDSKTMTWSSSGMSAFADPEEGPLLALGVENGNMGTVPTPTFDAVNTIPPMNANRTLVLCFDGTGDQ